VAASYSIHVIIFLANLFSINWEASAYAYLSTIYATMLASFWL